MVNERLNYKAITKLIVRTCVQGVECVLEGVLKGVLELIEGLPLLLASEDRMVYKG